MRNLITQNLLKIYLSMVCHETYKDQNGNWLYPSEIKKTNSTTAVKLTDNTKVIIGSSESMSKSKRTLLVEISEYGADAVRWFILSDSPPEKDVQWSATGVASANKFLQKVWNLNYLISIRENKKVDKKLEVKFNLQINNFVNKIDSSINQFRFNVSIAHFYELYKLFKDNLESQIGSVVIKNNMIKIMKLMIPFTPHLANECLELLNCKNVDNWPIIDKKIF